MDYIFGLFSNSGLNTGGDYTPQGAVFSGGPFVNIGHNNGGDHLPQGAGYNPCMYDSSVKCIENNTFS